MSEFNIASLLSSQRCIVDTASKSKKAVIEKLSHLIASDLVNVEHSDLFFELIEREKLGSTAIGSGVAVPHARSEKISAPVGALIKLDTPVEFNAEDEIKVDLIFGLIVPHELHESHLQILSALASLFKNSEWRDQLRNSLNSETLFDTIIGLCKQDLMENNE
jgi:PTS system nitrogen regulatory IIA component